MPYQRYVEIGRVCMINYGPQYGQLVVISDVLDQNRALVDAPAGRVRGIEYFKRLALTDLKIDIPRQASKKVLAAAYSKAEVDKKFKASAWGQKVAKRAATASMTDLDRYKAMVTKSKKARQVRTVLNQMKKVARGGVAKKGAAPAKKAAGKK